MSLNVSAILPISPTLSPAMRAEKSPTCIAWSACNSSVRLCSVRPLGSSPLTWRSPAEVGRAERSAFFAPTSSAICIDCSKGLRRTDAAPAKASSIARAKRPPRAILEPTWNPPHLSGLDLKCLDANADAGWGFRKQEKIFVAAAGGLATGRPARKYEINPIYQGPKWGALAAAPFRCGLSRQARRGYFLPPMTDLPSSRSQAEIFELLGDPATYDPRGAVTEVRRHQ